MLLRKLPRPDSGGPVDLGDDVVLASFKLKLETEGDLSLKAEGTGALPGPEYTGTGKGRAPTEKLSTIIQLINERFGTDFDAQDLVDGVTDQLVGDAALQQAARVNDKGNFAVPFHEALDDALVSRHEKHGDFINKVFQDQALGDFFRAWMLDQVYGKLSEVSPARAADR
jgi:type I restriction enzyme R subunit